MQKDDEKSKGDHNKEAIVPPETTKKNLIPFLQISHFLPNQEDQRENLNLIIYPSRIHHILLYTRYNLQRKIETKAQIGLSKKEKIVVKNKKKVIQRSRI